MKKIKTVFWVVLTCLIVLFVFQNQEVLTLKQMLKMDLYIASYQTPEIPIVVLFVCCFLIGYLLAYFFGLSSRLELKQKVKHLSEAVKTLQQQNAAREIEPSQSTPGEPVGSQGAGERPA